MADEKGKIPIPSSFLDHILYYELDNTDWTHGGTNKMGVINGNFSADSYVKWTGTTAHTAKYDTGGATKWGITASTWAGYHKKHPESTSNVNNITRKDWLDFVQYRWDDYSGACNAVNFVCACLIYQISWGGYRAEGYGNPCLEELKQKADKKDYPFIAKGGIFKKLSDATNAFSNPLVPYKIIRASKLKYLYDLGVSSAGQKENRRGWFRRIIVGFADDGLYLDDGMYMKENGLTKESTIEQWEAVAKKLRESNQHIKKILDYGASPESLAAIANMTSYDTSAGAAAAGAAGAVSMAPRELYSGCAGIYNLGDYTNSPDMTIIPQQTQNREEVLNTLMSGSYTPDEVTKCAELITVDKKKNVKIKRSDSDDSDKTQNPTKTEAQTKTEKTDNKEDTKKSKK